MTKPKIQIDDEIREMTNAEFAIYEAEQAKLAAEKTAAQAEANAKATAKTALLNKLGITAEEAKLLLS
jgi:hypothetical protein